MESSIATLVGDVARLFRRSFDARARNIGVTRPQWQVLVLLKRHEGINQGGLAELLEVEPITIGRMVDRLQEAGLVERRPDPADRRAWRLHSTERAAELLDQLRPMAQDMMALAYDGLSEEDQAHIIASLERVRQNLSRKTPQQLVSNG